MRRFTLTLVGICAALAFVGFGLVAVLPVGAQSPSLLFVGSSTGAFPITAGQQTAAISVPVVLASDGTVVPGTGATNLGKGEDAAHTTGDVGVLHLGVRKDTGAQTTSADADYTFPALDAYSAAFVREDHPNRISCVVTVSTATTLTAVGNSCAAPGAGLSIYVTDVAFGSSAASTTAADSFPTLKYGTGGTCGTGTAVWWQALTAANTTFAQTVKTPVKIPANNEICWIHSVAGSKTIQLNGFIAP